MQHEGEYYDAAEQISQNQRCFKRPGSPPKILGNKKARPESIQEHPSRE